MIFAINYTFTGWTPQYIYFHMPVRWFRYYADKLIEVSERQQAAAKNRPYVPNSELSEQAMAAKNERIRKMREGMEDGEDI